MPSLVGVTFKCRWQRMCLKGKNSLNRKSNVDCCIREERPVQPSGLELERACRWKVRLAPAFFLPAFSLIPLLQLSALEASIHVITVLEGMKKVQRDTDVPSSLWLADY